jgi:hypothetical protein
MAAKPLPPAEYLRQCFAYDPVTGLLTWQQSRPREHFRTDTGWRSWTNSFAGRTAGYLDHTSTGYFKLWVCERPHWAHRVIWKIQTGIDPVGEIDHRNGNRADNRWANLREATHQQNLWNLPTKRGRLPTGVFVHRKGYGAKAGGVHLGKFDTAEQAADAYRSYIERIRGEFASTR